MPLQFFEVGTARGGETDHLNTAAICASLYWITQISALAYPGSAAVDPPGTATFPQGKFAFPALALVGLGYLMERARTTSGRPDRRTRRDNGKSDPVDAYAAAPAVLSGRAQGIPTSRNGIAGAIRALRAARNSADQGPHPDPHRPCRSTRAVPGIAHGGADRPPGPLPPCRRSGGPRLRRQNSSAASRPPLSGTQPGDRRPGR
ncbi:DUF6640 family protein [Streptomyces sp. TG1A-8]|uniref:DUF6640 family protein n=1 Tax=Streptomyces sp. TG1A-8 TaxID=3051385 RepID=UPI003463FC4C